MSAGATVTQDARNAASKCVRHLTGNTFAAVDIVQGGSDRSAIVEIFARFETEIRLATAAEFAAREAALVEALEIAWAEAHRMRNAAKLVGPYPNDRVATKVWARSLYHAGKDLCEKLKPYRALARAHTTSEGEG